VCLKKHLAGAKVDFDVTGWLPKASYPRILFHCENSTAVFELHLLSCVFTSLRLTVLASILLTLLKGNPGSHNEVLQAFSSMKGLLPGLLYFVINCFKYSYCTNTELLYNRQHLWHYVYDKTTCFTFILHFIS